MTAYIYTKRILLSFGLAVLLFSCDDDIPSGENTNQIPDSVLLINNFIHDNMEFAYYWNDLMPDLDPKQQTDPEKYFYDLLYDEIDRWSFITDDYQGLIDYFSGIQKSTGYSYRLYKVSDESNDVVGFVEYVNPNTPASRAGLKRTDMFFEVDGEKLTTDNYQTLLSKDEYTLTLGELNEDLTITPLSPKIDLIAETLTINPILLDTIIEYEGEKIGYLVYNSFVSDYDSQLEDVFGKFKEAGINDLVLDLRYNYGGSVNTAVMLASMIVPAGNEGKVLLNNDFNDNLSEYFKNQYPGDESIFKDTIRSTPNNLNLSRYVALTTFKTASASEMVIYTLMPYMDVIQIGEQTHGKYYASITLHDEERSKNWAIQPIVMRAENADNSIDYSQGLIPDIELRERYEYQLGDIREKFLAQALFELTGVWPEGSTTTLKNEISQIKGQVINKDVTTDNRRYIMYKNIDIDINR
ncbi:MAG: peptidase S41 [Chlorobi bacterium]|nr:peptidase S41 [Chlorobiota bacterium]